MRDDGNVGDYAPEQDGYVKSFSFRRSAGSSVRRVVRTVYAVYYFITRRRDGF
jgi:hypothetical protein